MIKRLVLSFIALAVVVGAAVSLWIASTDANTNVALSIRKTRAGANHIKIEHRDWPGNEWTLRIPEYLVVHKNVDKAVRPSAEKGEDGVITISGVRTSHGELEYTFVLKPGWDKIDLVATVTNTGTRPLDRATSALACLIFADAPDFFDPNASSTFVLVDGELTSISEIGLRSGKPQEFRHNGHALRVPDVKWLQSRKPEVEHVPADGGLIIRSSQDGTRHVAQIWDDVFTVAYNFHRELNCTHSNPRFGVVVPGETSTLHGRIYFFKGDREQLYEMVKRDFPGLGLEPVTR